MFKNVALYPLSFFTIRLLILGSSLGDAIAVAAFCCLYGYSLWLEHKASEKVTKQVRDEVAALHSKLSAIEFKVNIGTKFAK
jgi:hypothetical protein